MKYTISLLAAILALSATGLAAPLQSAQSDWQDILTKELPRMGHRNFIVVADSAYPLQSSPGIRTLYTGGEQLDVLKTVLEAIQKSDHVRPIIYLDAELDVISDEAAPGIESYREELATLLESSPAVIKPHMEIIEKLDATAELFNVLILKSDLTLPYTSVFIELDCAYWSAVKEAELRESLSNQ